MYGCSLHKWLELVAPLGGEQGRLLPRGHCRRAPSQNYLQEYSAITKDQFTLMRQKITSWAPLQYKGQCVRTMVPPRADHKIPFLEFYSMWSSPWSSHLHWNFFRNLQKLSTIFWIGQKDHWEHRKSATKCFGLKMTTRPVKVEGSRLDTNILRLDLFWLICRSASGLRILKLHLNYFINIALYYVSMISGFESNYQYRNNLCS